MARVGPLLACYPNGPNSAHGKSRPVSGDITRANIQPAKREKVLARYGAGATAVAEPEVLVDTDIAPDQHSPTGEYVCPNCGHHYSEKAGEPREGFPPGTPWADIPATWSCSACGVRDKIDFRPVT